MRLIATLLLFVLATVPIFSADTQSALVAAMDHKLDHIEANGALAKPDTKPTSLTEDEINAYFAAGRIKLPDGVQSVRFAGASGVVTAVARVDFDRIRASQRSSNPLLSLFSGTHDVQVVAHASGRNGKGRVQVDSAALDGVEVPNFLLELFVEKYIQSKHPEIGMTSQFALPDRIDMATVENHQLTLIQK